jgi:SPP1 family predicted phage head-tail adaptor
LRTYPKSTAHPGELRHRIEIGKTENMVNENGYPEPNDTVICTVWASVSDNSSRRIQTADSSVAEAGRLFVIRYRDELQPGMWVRFLNEKWTIAALEGYGHQRRYLGLQTYLTKGVSG